MRRDIMKRVLMAIGAASMLALAGAANAEQQLNEAQLDNVTASGTAIANAFGVALGGFQAATVTYTSSIAQGLVFVPVQVGGVWVVGTGVESYSESVASN
jgi:hypothetical protein